MDTMLLAIIATFTVLHWVDGNKTAQLCIRRTKRFVLKVFGKPYRG